VAVIMAAVLAAAVAAVVAVIVAGAVFVAVAAAVVRIALVLVSLSTALKGQPPCRHEVRLISRGQSSPGAGEPGK
jgi:hypothetical protein